MQGFAKDSLKIFWTHAKRYRTLVFVLSLSTVFIALVNLLIPVLYSNFFNLITNVDKNNADEFYKGLFYILIQIFLANLVIWLFSRVQHLTNNYFESRTSANLLNTCFDHISDKPSKFFASNSVGSLVGQANRFVWAFEGINEEFFWYLIPLVLEIVGIFFMVIQKNLLMGVIFFFWTAAFILINCIFARFKYKFDLKFNTANSASTGYFADTVLNNFSVKAFSGEQFESSSFKKRTEKQFRLKLFSWNIGQIFQAIQSFFMIALEFLIFFIALKLWKNNSFAVADFVLIEIYLINLFRKLIDFERIIRQIHEYLASAEEMTNYISDESKKNIVDDAISLKVNKGTIEFKDVLFHYPNEIKACLNIDLKINPQEKVAIVGPSGSGKSTLFKLLLRLYDVQSGDILIDGQNIKEVSLASLRNNISIVPQEPILFQRSILENIRYGDFKASNEEVMNAARLADCYDFIMQLPEGFNTKLGEGGANISGGGRQHIAIARAILKNAPILLLDEATSSMDSYSELLTQKALKNLIQDKTVIVIAHRLSTISQMDRIIVLNDGKIEEEGTHSSLMLQPNCLYKKLWQTQQQHF